MKNKYPIPHPIEDYKMRKPHINFLNAAIVADFQYYPKKRKYHTVVNIHINNEFIEIFDLKACQRLFAEYKEQISYFDFERHIKNVWESSPYSRVNGWRDQHHKR